MKIHPENALAMACVAAAALLYGCSDGTATTAGISSSGGVGSGPGDSGFVAETDIPISATTSSAGAFSFVNGVVATGGSETGEPLAVGNAELASSETDEPDTGV